MVAEPPERLLRAELASRRLDGRVSLTVKGKDGHNSALSDAT